MKSFISNPDISWIAVGRPQFMNYMGYRHGVLKKVPGLENGHTAKGEIWNRMGKLSLFLNYGLCWESCS